jgi:phosphate transport system protein
MQARPHQVPGLADLQQQLLRLAESVDRVLVGTIWALSRGDVNEAQQVVDGNTAIIGLRYELEESAIQLLALNAHMPYDVRTISTIMFVAAELERIGDYAEGIATTMLRQVDVSSLSMPSTLGQMAHKARAMLQSAIRALIRRDAAAAARLDRSDDAFDQLYQGLLQEVLSTIRAQPEAREWATYVLWIGHNLERIAEQAVNIAERVAVGIGAAVPRHQRASERTPHGTNR